MSGAGWSRVTHPFATLLAPEGAFSFDLHVLGTPPAFILSQDQTLRSKGGPVSGAPAQTDSVPVWKCCLSIRTAASEMRRIKINVKDRNDGSLSSDSHVSIRTTRWHITIYRLFTLCGQYPVLKVPAGPRPAAPPGWDQLPLRAARGSILRASPPPVNRILEIFSRARFRGPRPRPGRCGTENSTPAAGAGQGGSGDLSPKPEQAASSAPKCRAPLLV